MRIREVKYFFLDSHSRQVAYLFCLIPNPTHSLPYSPLTFLVESLKAQRLVLMIQFAVDNVPASLAILTSPMHMSMRHLATGGQEKNLG